MTISARQFAEMYPGHVVKLSVDGAKEFGIKLPTTPLGTVVGFRPGTKGVVGSSKVVIWRNKGELIMALNPNKTTTYNPVTLTLSNPLRGESLYFLSVSSIDLAEPKKTIIAYPSHCRHCGSPARKGKWFTICSKAHCKMNKLTIKALGPFPKIKIVDEKGFVLCPFCQTNQLDISSKYANQYNLICYVNKHAWKHDWKEGQKMNYRGMSIYIWKNKQLTTP